jgi:hypothetical protein
MFLSQDIKLAEVITNKLCEYYLTYDKQTGRMK